MGKEKGGGNTQKTRNVEHPQLDKKHPQKKIKANIIVNNEWLNVFPQDWE